VSNLCKTQLCATLQNVIGNASTQYDTTDFLFSTLSIDKCTSDRISKVSFADLPDANTVPSGHIAYLDDAKVPIIASNGTWIGFDGRTIGTFTASQLFGWGGGSCGRTGVDTLNRCSPARERCSATDWRQVSGGSYHSAAVKTSGELWTWGGNFCGVLGDGSVTTRISPFREFCSATDWCQVDANSSTTAAVKTTGQIWVWGLNSSGQLGDGTVTSRCSPAREICSATDWCQVSAGNCHVAAVKTSGEIWSWGNGGSGRIGDGAQYGRCSPVREICSATDWCGVSANRAHTVAIKTSGQIWGWGAGTCGAIGVGSNSFSFSPVREFCSATDWCQVNTSNAYSTAAIKTSGQLWSWGSNYCGQLGDGTATTRFSPVREICSATDWCLVSRRGSTHTMAIKTSGQLWSWGGNVYGQIGDGSVITRFSPVREITSAADWCTVSSSTSRHSLGIRSVIIVCR